MKVTPKQRVEKYYELLKQGKTLYFTNTLQSVQVSPKTLRRFQKANAKLFDYNDKNTWIARGKNWDCADGYRVTFTD